MDPAGLSMENFDAIGRWRAHDGGAVIDASGEPLGAGRTSRVSPGCDVRCSTAPEVFVGTMIEKLLIYALGRGMEHTDAPAIRAIVGAAADEDYRLSSLILGVVRSTPFQMRRSQS